MRKMGIDAIYPIRSLTKAGKVSYIKPYLLRNLKVTRPNQVWSIDITHVPMAHGHMYLVAIIDVFSRRILSWKLGNTLDASESVEVLQQAIARFGTPEIINSDQGSQYTSGLWACAIAGATSAKSSKKSKCFLFMIMRFYTFMSVYNENPKGLFFSFTAEKQL